MPPPDSETTSHPRRREPDESESADRAGEDAKHCPECDSRLVFHSSGELVCEDCGLVVAANLIDYGPEWRAFDATQRREQSRVGAPRTNTIHDRGLSTKIDWRDRDGYGSALSERKRRKMRRLRTWDERFRTRNASERNLRHALTEIDRMASALGLPDTTREIASVLYRRALEEELMLGRSIEAMSAASVYAATRQAGIPRSIDEVVTVSRVEKGEMTRAYRYLLKELELPMKPPDPIEYVGRYASKLEVTDETERRARELLEVGKRAGLHHGRDPVGLVAAALYAASRLTGERITQSETAAVADVCEMTIRTHYNELLEADE